MNIHLLRTLLTIKPVFWNYDEIIFHLYISINPIEIGHSVGIHYTLDNWTNTLFSTGEWIENDKNNEIWHIELLICGGNKIIQLPDNIIFALYVKKNNDKIWNNNNNLNFKINFDELILQIDKEYEKYYSMLLSI